MAIVTLVCVGLLLGYGNELQVNSKSDKINLTRDKDNKAPRKSIRSIDRVSI